MAQRTAAPRPKPRLYLVTPPIEDATAFAAPLSVALGAGDIAAVLLRLKDGDERGQINSAKTLVRVAQDKDVALIVETRAQLVARAGADGAHLTGIEDFTEALPSLKPDRIAGCGGLASRHDAMLAAEAGAGADGAHLTGIEALNEALPGLKPDRIAGCGGLASRHDAMLAAEGGADYVMFGEPDEGGVRPAFAAIEERVGWWAEVFEIPCVGYAATLDEVAALVFAGADFVALGDFVWREPQHVAAQVNAAAQRLALPETTA